MTRRFVCDSASRHAAALAAAAKVAGNDEDKLTRITRAARDMTDEMTTWQKQPRVSPSEELQRPATKWIS